MRKRNRHTNVEGLTIDHAVACGIDGRQWPRVDVSENSFPSGSTDLDRYGDLTVRVPFNNDPYARAVRMHEQLHAAHSFTPKALAIADAEIVRFGNKTHQCLEDMHIHLNKWPTYATGEMHDDMLEAAKIDLNNVFSTVAWLRENNIDLNTEDKRERAAIIGMYSMLFRALAIQAKLDSGSYCKTIYKVRRKIGAKVTGLIGPIISSMLSKDRRPNAAMLLASLMQELPAPLPPRGSGAPTNGRSLDGGADDTGDPDTYGGNGAEDRGGTLGEYDHPFKLINLPLTVRVKPHPVSYAKRTAIAGRKILTKRLARVAVDPSTRVFVRSRRLEGGCVLIDASGSMRISSALLCSLVECMPMATVAYYYGIGECVSDKDGKSWGHICIAADGGKRAEDTPRQGGGNAIDYYALQWLRTQPGPLWYVGDLQFCGGPEGQAQAASCLFDSMIARGEVEHFPTIDGAINAARRLCGVSTPFELPDDED